MRVNVTMSGASRAVRRQSLSVALTVLVAVGGRPAVALGQTGVSHTENAAPVPRGMVRFSATPSWLRYDARFTGSGTEPLGAMFAAESLGTAQLPAFTRFEGALRRLTGDDAFRLSLGAARATSSVRVATTPVSLEYGLTRRLSFGVMVPIVQRRRELILDIQTQGPLATGNVGPVGTSVQAAMYARASQLATAIDAAATLLSQRISQCTAQPAGSGCAPITANPGGARATANAGREIAASLRYVYGTSAAEPGVGLVPHARLTTSIDARLQTLNADFATYLGAAPVADPTAPAGALGVATAENLRSFGRQGRLDIGPDSLGSIATLGIGDVELAARYLLWDTRGRLNEVDSTQLPGTRLRVTVGALARLGTGVARNDDELFAMGASDGQTDAEASVAVDLEGLRGFGATILGRYTAQFGQVVATRLPDQLGRISPFDARGLGSRTLGNILALEASPRFRLGRSLYLSGHYALLHRADDSYAFPSTELVDPAPWPPGLPALPQSASAGGFTEQRAGVGISYSTVAAWERGAVRVPIEVSYMHLETFSGTNAMVPRAGRDQIQLRVYYRRRR